ncbi:MAG TPA: hypothetical protein VEO01_01830 [Pseudonocardiaceae bacterium]|nr:hypothetical protein [Pseudonocardiaceae bacterium]
MVRGTKSLVAAMTLVSAALAGCTASGTSDVLINGWRSVPPPSLDARVLAIVPDGNGLLVLGSVPGTAGRAPGAWTTTDGRSWHPVPLIPHTVYAAQAELIAVGSAGGRVTVLGQAFGGAHSNPRLTVWTGNTGGLVEHEQPTEMFGGPHAIATNDAAAIPGTALLVGQWDGATGRYGAAVWTSADGATWHRNADEPAMTSASGEQTSALGATAGPNGFLVAGDTLRGSQLAPLVWTSPDGGTWRRIPLPIDSDGGATANRAACDASNCVVAGITLGSEWHAMCWPMVGATVGHGTSGPGGTTMQVSQVLVHDSETLIALRVNDKARLESTGRDCAGWRDVPLPITSNEVRIGELSTGLLLATTDQTASQLWLRTSH